jgi:hypothetical protein
MVKKGIVIIVVCFEGKAFDENRRLVPCVHCAINCVRWRVKFSYQLAKPRSVIPSRDCKKVCFYDGFINLLRKLTGIRCKTNEKGNKANDFQSSHIDGPALYALSIM